MENSQIQSSALVAAMTLIFNTTVAVASSKTESIEPPEWKAGCPVPSFEQCTTPGYLEGKLDDANQCGRLQGKNDWTCSQLLQESLAEYAQGASIFAKSLVPMGVVENAAHIPQDPEDAVATLIEPELTSPASLAHGASMVSDNQAGTLYASGQAGKFFAIEDPRGIWPENGQEMNSCREYAHERYYEVTNFWYEVGNDRHDYQKVYDIAFGPFSSHAAIGTHHLNSQKETYFFDIRGENTVLPVSRQVYRNRFFDLPLPASISDMGLKDLTTDASVSKVSNANADQAPNLGHALKHYDPQLGAEIVALVESNSSQGTKGMKFYQDSYENMTVEGAPKLGWVAPTDKGGSDGDTVFDASYTSINQDDSNEYGLTNLENENDRIAITGQIPLSYTGGKSMHRMFTAELDELYDLQKKKDRLMADWFELDRQFAGSGWIIQDLQAELDPQLDLILTGELDQGTCCGPSQSFYTENEGDEVDLSGPEKEAAGPEKVDSYGFLTPESAARKRVLDELLAVYEVAIENGCLESGVTYCEFSLKEFARDAITHAVEQQQSAYEYCLRILPSPFNNNLNTTRKIIDPESDTEEIAAEDPGWFNQVTNNEYAELLAAECFVEVNHTMTADHLKSIETQTKQCRSQVPGYRAQLASLLASYTQHKATQEAKARLAQIPELFDPVSGAFKRPGHSESWSERKGSKYFGLEMAYNFGFASDVDHEVCNFDLAAGGDFYAAIDILTAHVPLIDIAAWTRSGSDINIASGDNVDKNALVDIHAEALGVALFDGIHVSGLANGEEIGLNFARVEWREQADYAGFETNFMLGPIPMSLEVGAAGGVGMRFELSDSSGFTAFEGIGKGIDVCPSLTLDGVLEPYIGVYGFIEVALDVVIAEAGVRGEIALMETSMPVYFNLGLDETEPVSSLDDFDLKLEVGMSVAAKLNILSGIISAYGEVGFCPFCARVEKNIVKWDGFSYEKTLFSHDYDVSVQDLIRAQEG